MPKVINITAHDKCPICGCLETITQRAMQPLKDEGKIEKDAFVHMGMRRLNMMSPSVIALTLPVLFTYWDACAECGIEYCTRAERVDVPITAQVKGGGELPPAAAFG